MGFAEGMYLLQEKVTEIKCDCTYTVNILGVVYLFVYNYSYQASYWPKAATFMQCTTCISSFVAEPYVLLYTTEINKSAGKDDNFGMTYQPVKMLNQNVLYIFMWQSNLPSKPRDSATCPLECANLTGKVAYGC